VDVLTRELHCPLPGPAPPQEAAEARDLHRHAHRADVPVLLLLDDLHLALEEQGDRPLPVTARDGLVRVRQHQRVHRYAPFLWLYYGSARGGIRTRRGPEV